MLSGRRNSWWRRSWGPAESTSCPGWVFSVYYDKYWYSDLALLAVQTGGYFTASPPPAQSPPVTPPPLTPSPEAVEKATNPIALRYWAQCLDKNTEPARVLTTAGTGVSRDNEVVEARNNINRFITVDKVKKKEAGRVVRSQSQSRVESPAVRPYRQVKEDQIKISQDRANFHNRAVNLEAKSPQPFRRGLSESRSFTREEREERVVRQPSTDSLLSLNDNQKAKLIQVTVWSPGCLSVCNCETLTRFYWTNSRLMLATPWWRRDSPASTPAVCTASRTR